MHYLLHINELPPHGIQPKLGDTLEVHDNDKVWHYYFYKFPSKFYGWRLDLSRERTLEKSTNQIWAEAF